MLLIKEDLYDRIIDDLPDPVNNDWSEKDLKKKKTTALINLCTDNT